MLISVELVPSFFFKLCSLFPTLTTVTFAMNLFWSLLLISALCLALSQAQQRYVHIATLATYEFCNLTLLLIPSSDSTHLAGLGLGGGLFPTDSLTHPHRNGYALWAQFVNQNGGSTFTQNLALHLGGFVSALPSNHEPRQNFVFKFVFLLNFNSNLFCWLCSSSQNASSFSTPRLLPELSI